MKKLLILLFSIFFLSSPSVFADDISDFQIEGISIGDSLLDYMTEEEILEEVELSISLNDYHDLSEPLKYVDVYLYKDFPTYDKISFLIKNNSTNQYVTNINEKFTILFIRGNIEYIKDFDSCIQKRGEIVEVLSEMFPNAQKTEMIDSFRQDPSGNSIWDDITLYLDSGDKVRAWCSNWEEDFRIENNLSEGLSVAIQPKEISNWFSN